MARVQEFPFTLNTSGTSAPATVPAGGIPAGEFLTIDVCARSSAAQTVSATDTRGNTWALDRSDTIGAGGTTAAVVSRLSCKLTTALQAGDTITVAFGTTVTRAAGSVQHFDDDVISTNAGANGDNGGAASTTATSGNATTDQADCLLVGGIGWVTSARVLTADSPWNPGTKVASTAGTVDRAVQSMWRYVTSAGNYAASGTFDSTGSTYAALIQAYRIAAGTTGTLPSVVEADAAQPFTGAKTGTLPVATETDTAQVLTAVKAGALPVVTETDTAQVLAGAKVGTLPPAVEADQAQPFTGTKIGLLPTVIEVDEARPFTGDSGVRRDITVVAETPPVTAWSDTAPVTGWTDTEPATAWSDTEPVLATVWSDTEPTL